MMEHYYSKEQTSTIKIKKARFSLKGFNFLFFLSSGVFSKEKIDDGTALLCNKMKLKSEDSVLDVGCGVGVIGIVASRFVTSAKLVDTNMRAIEMSLKNAYLNKCKNVKVLESDLYSNLKSEKFDVILSNPPQSAGKELCFRLIFEAKEHLKKGGSLQIVARHNKGGKTLSLHMKDVFSNVSELGKAKGYRVYVSYNT